MYGCYVTSDDEKFIDVITDELDKFNVSNKSSSILLFPSLSSRHRLLLHRLRENKYPDLSSFSVGEDKNTRRTVICFKCQLMDEANLEPSTIETLKNTPSPTSTQSNGESTTRRRPDQVFYQPPRRSKNSETSVTVTTVTTSSIDESQQMSDKKAVKTKCSRPSMEPYVPPSRRNQTNDKETSSISPLATTVSDQNAEDESKRKIVKSEEDDGETEEWENLLDVDGNLVNDITEEIQAKFKENVRIKNPVNDYLQWSVEDMQTKEKHLSHVIEVSNFPSTFRTEDILNSFKTLTRNEFDIKWVDDTHALIVFSDTNTALDVLQIEHPLFKVCSISQASVASKKKAKTCIDSLQPYKIRPVTSSLTANRRICAALGLKNPMSSDKAKSERQKIETARQQKIRDKEEQKIVWDGGIIPTTTPTT